MPHALSSTFSVWQHHLSVYTMQVVVMQCGGVYHLGRGGRNRKEEIPFVQPNCAYILLCIRSTCISKVIYLHAVCIISATQRRNGHDTFTAVSYNSSSSSVVVETCCAVPRCLSSHLHLLFSLLASGILCLVFEPCLIGLVVYSCCCCTCTCS